MNFAASWIERGPNLKEGTEAAVRLAGAETAPEKVGYSGSRYQIWGLTPLFTEIGKRKRAIGFS